MEEALGFDIGGSSIKTATVDTDSGKLLSSVTQLPLPEPSTPPAVLKLIAVHLEKLDWQEPFGVGYPGVIQRGCTMTACHMGSGWIGCNFLAQLQTLSKQAVALLNDADAAALAEMRFGAGSDMNNPDGGTVLLITLGTGIGTALFRKGVLFPNTELGHIEMDGAEAEDTAAASQRSELNLDWAAWGKRVNRYLEEMEKLLWPDRIIVGGGVSEHFDRFRPYLKTRAELQSAQLINNAGVVGAALAASEQ
jgi:polyphosphate glucokinase